MPSAAYALLKYVGRLDITIADAGNVISSIGYLTKCSIDTGARIRNLIYFTKLSVFAQPTRMLTGIPTIGPGQLSTAGVFSGATNADAADNAVNVLNMLRSDRYVQEITFTPSSPAGATVTPIVKYFRHCVVGSENLVPAQIGGVSVLKGSVIFAFSHCTDANSPRYSSSTYDLSYTF